MYVERISASPVGYEGEVFYFPAPWVRHQTFQGAIIPDSITLARQSLMNPDQTTEVSPGINQENQPSILQTTRRALENLFIKAVFQKNGIVAGSCLRLQSEIDSKVEKAPSPVEASIKMAAINQVDPKDILGNKFQDKNYIDDFSLLYALANLRQTTGSLDTGNIEANLKMPEQFRNLNGRLFDLNRSGGNETVLEDLNLAVRLKQAFPEQADQIDVHDVHFSQNGVMKGHAIEIARKYLERAQNGQLFNPAVTKVEPLHISTRLPISPEFHPRYQTELASGYQVNLGSNAVAGTGILRFLADFDPGFALKNADHLVLDQAEKDLADFKRNHPKLLNDPNIVLIFGEHLANIQMVKNKSAVDVSKRLPVLKSA